MGNVRPKFIYAGSRLGAELLEGPFKRPGQANSMMTARTVRTVTGLGEDFLHHAVALGEWSIAAL